MMPVMMVSRRVRHVADLGLHLLHEFDRTGAPLGHPRFQSSLAQGLGQLPVLPEKGTALPPRCPGLGHCIWGGTSLMSARKPQANRSGASRQALHRGAVDLQQRGDEEEARCCR